MEEAQSKFTFQYLSGKQFTAFNNKDVQENLMKWSMKGRLITQCFSFDQPFKPYQKDDFGTAFMQDPSVYRNLKVATSSGSQVPLNMKCDKVMVEHVPCSLLNMSFFDRLYADDKIAREGGILVKCLDDYCDGITIADELRKMLLLEDSDNYDLYNDSERAEFLFCLFKHICLGGAVCQYEDNVQVYLDTTKLLYKDLVSVQKDQGTGNLHITSTVFKIKAMDKDDSVLYPCDEDHEQNFAYLAVDPLKRHVTVLYHKFGAPLFDQ